MTVKLTFAEHWYSKEVRKNTDKKRAMLIARPAICNYQYVRRVNSQNSSFMVSLQKIKNDDTYNGGTMQNDKLFHNRRKVLENPTAILSQATFKHV